MSKEHYHEIFQRYMTPPGEGEWTGPLDEGMKRNFDLLYKEIVLHWVDTEFREAVRDLSQIEEAAAVVKVSQARGDSVMGSVQVLIGTFTLELTKQHREDVVRFGLGGEQ